MGTFKLEISALIVIEAPQRPGVRIVAVGAFLVHARFVDIINAMAIDAGAFRLMKFEVTVTALAGGDRVHSLQRKRG